MDNHFFFEKWEHIFPVLGAHGDDCATNKRKHDADDGHNEEAGVASKLVCRHIGVVESSPICGICRLVCFFHFGIHLFFFLNWKYKYIFTN